MMPIEHIAILVSVLIGIMVIFEWGWFIFTIAALWCFLSGHILYGVLAFLFAGCLEGLKAPVMFVARAFGYRGPWV